MCKKQKEMQELWKRKGKKDLQREEAGKGQRSGRGGLEDKAWQVQSDDLHSRDKVDVDAAAGGSLKMLQTERHR